jgi:hypothetical protein
MFLDLLLPSRLQILPFDFPLFRHSRAERELERRESLSAKPTFAASPFGIVEGIANPDDSEIPTAAPRAGEAAAVVGQAVRRCLERRKVEAGPVPHRVPSTW